MTNPLLGESTLPYRLPDFAQLTPQAFREGIEHGMRAQLAELEAAATDDAPPTEESVLAPRDRSGLLLTRALQAFWAVQSSNTTDEMDAVRDQVIPQLAAHSDTIQLDRRLYDRLVALRDRADAGAIELDEQASWFTDELIRDHVRAGVLLDHSTQTELRGLNTRIAELESSFDKMNRQSRNAGAIDVTGDELEGLSDDEIEALRTPGGGFRIELVNTTGHPLLSKLANRGVRQRLFEASVARSLMGEFDTRALVVEIARARAERATLLGYPHHAALVAESACAKTSGAVRELMQPIGRAAHAQVVSDAQQLAKRFAELHQGEEFAAWDWEYVAEMVRAERFDLKPEALEAHLSIEAVRTAMYAAATDLYGITFEPRPDLRGHTVDAEVFEVRDAGGSPVGLFCMDFWARPSKSGGAWMTNLVDQSHDNDTLPVVTNDCNFSRSAKTIAWDDVITMFHEFGHALHGLFADSRYASLSGTNTPRDFVEFPSQVNEHWAWEAGRVLPEELATRMREASKFNQGYSTLEVMAATLLDQAWHTTGLDELPTSPDEVEEFETRALDAWGVRHDLVPPRYRTQYFAHIWGGGYAAAYYGYTWSQVMDADAVAWFEERGGGSRSNGEYFRRTLLAPGGSVDPTETFRRFRGRDPQVGPLLDRLGLSDAVSAG